MKQTQEENTVAAPLLTMVMGLGPIGDTDQIGVQANTELDTAAAARLYHELQGNGQAFVDTLTTLASGGSHSLCDSIASYMVQSEMIPPEHMQVAIQAMLKATLSGYQPIRSGPEIPLGTPPDGPPHDAIYSEVDRLPLFTRIGLALRLLFNRID